MKHQDPGGVIPRQYTGKEIEAASSTELKDESDAKAFYSVATGRLLNVNSWHKAAGIISAVFQVVDQNLQEVDRPVQKGDYIKIDIPGPGSKAGDGFDWVQVEEFNETENGNTQSTGFRVRPVKNPHGVEHQVAHFYSAESTSSFIVTRNSSQLVATIIDRNIKPNDNAGSLTDKIRDTSIGLGAIGIFSKLQWQSLADGLLKQINK